MNRPDIGKIARRVEAVYGRTFDFSNHTLRMTGGRMLRKAGIDLETISAILGHESISTPIDYLFLSYDNMNEGMKKLAQYQNAVICPQNGIFRDKPDEMVSPKRFGPAF
jgi:integrase